MAAIAKRQGKFRAYPLAASFVLTGDAPAILTSNGLLTNVGTVGICAGITRMGVDNSQGTDKAQRATVEIGEHLFTNAGDVLDSHIGSTVYFSTDGHVSIDSATDSRSTAGKVTEVAAQGVWVELGI